MVTKSKVKSQAKTNTPSIKKSHDILLFFLAMTACVFAVSIIWLIGQIIYANAYTGKIGITIQIFTSVTAITLIAYYLLRDTGLIISRRSILSLVLGILVSIFLSILLITVIDHLLAGDACAETTLPACAGQPLCEPPYTEIAQDNNCLFNTPDLMNVSAAFVSILYLAVYTILRTRARKLTKNAK